MSLLNDEFMDKVLFKETQSNKILIIGAALFSVFFGVFTVLQVVLGKPVGNHPAPDWLLIALFAGSILSIIFFNKQKLILEITEKEISVSYGLLTSDTKIAVDDIKSIQVRKYDALKEFTGWGVRYNDSESCFTVSGNDALEIEIKSGTKFLIGTQKPEEIIGVIATLPSFSSM